MTWSEPVCARLVKGAQSQLTGHVLTFCLLPSRGLSKFVTWTAADRSLDWLISRRAGLRFAFWSSCVLLYYYIGFTSVLRHVELQSLQKQPWLQVTSNFIISVKVVKDPSDLIYCHPQLRACVSSTLRSFVGHGNNVKPWIIITWPSSCSSQLHLVACSSKLSWLWFP